MVNAYEVADVIVGKNKAGTAICPENEALHIIWGTEKDLREVLVKFLTRSIVLERNGERSRRSLTH